MSTLLIVEDDRLFRTLLARRLALRGWEVYAAASVAEGLGELAAHRPDVLLLDLGLPDGSGWEVLSAAAPGTPAIVMTCRDVSAEERRTYRPVKILTKPLSLADLFALLERHAPGAPAPYSSGEARC